MGCKRGVNMKRYLRWIWATAFVVLLLLEVLIALFAHDSFIRPYFGDVLVTVLLCSLVRIFFPQGIRALPFFVFLFALLVEIGQWFDFVRLLGLENNRFLSVLMGRSFSIFDIVCYGAGCFAFWLAEYFLAKSFLDKSVKDGYNKVNMRE